MLQHFDTLEELTAAFPGQAGLYPTLPRDPLGQWSVLSVTAAGTKIYHFADDKTHKCGELPAAVFYQGRVRSSRTTKLLFKKWFIAIWLITSHKKGIASTQLARDVGVTQKTAWFMTHRLREAAKTQILQEAAGRGG